MNEEQITKQIELLLEAIEPWLLQLLRFNNDEPYMAAARREAAQKLVAIAAVIEKEE